MKNFNKYLNSNTSKNAIKFFMAVLLIFCSVFTLSGCSRNVVGYHVKSLPKKVVYQIGETVSYDGLVIEAINNDETYSKCRINNSNISSVDTTTAGVKKVVVEKNKMSISFNIYVANIVVNDSDDLKQTLQAASDGDIVYLRAGNYAPKTQQDQTYNNVIINKSLSLIGDGADKTKFFGNFIVGANYDGSVFTKIDNFEDVTFYGIGFELSYELKDNYINYFGPYNKTDTNGAIRCFDTQNLNINNCTFKGYGYGILADNSNGLIVTNCMFNNIQKSAIKTLTDTQNCTIFKNIFRDIASNVVSFDGEIQSITGAIQLNFTNKGHKGVLICKNLFNKIALHNDNLIFYDEPSKTASQTYTNGIFSGNYLNNYYVIALISSNLDDLEVTGVVLSSNNYSANPQIIFTGTKGKNTINTNGIIILD